MKAGASMHSVSTVLRRLAVGMVGVLVAFFLTGEGAIRAQAGPTIIVIPHPMYGTIVADPGGWTLYTWAGDEPGVSNCMDECAAVWIPYTVDREPVVPDGLAERLEVIPRDDGGWQVGFRYWPLYYFSGDVNPGDVNGDGV